MAKRTGTPPVVYIVIFIIIGGVGYWYLSQNSSPQPDNLTTVTVSPPSTVSPPPTSNNTTFSLPTSVPNGTTISIDGSTAMVAFNQGLKSSFERQFPGSIVNTQATGTEKGIQALMAGQIDLAAVSRPLTSEEKNQGLVEVPIATDQIAVVVSINNPFRLGLTSDQIQQIFTGKITNWSAVGGPDATIRVINRPPISGTHQMFQEIALQGQNFGTTSNITTLPRDETTGMLRQLNNDGIGYATYSQVVNQQTVRVVAIDGVTPEATNYPYQRPLSYVYKNPASPPVQAFLGYVTSSQGTQTISDIQQ
ncbi:MULTISPECIES: phosphate ABC transporter substrate-binding protein [Limnospira]|uniref:ABC-type phosphate transport system, periplasmic component, PstS-like n=1 Tax=Limnospira indica PCC 8005 TaxID=376219 RepID=A0A9P1KB47_9CYAN|nr:phosphate ABC transporter substrate-binding protein [Limnospira indica]RAQ44631.1 porin [Arthrospira sp. O9.13F]CDM92799.1 putative ABC-type phosphate transport system, periplasmic component, PstS-like [Limnospira indica PCC 8005]